MQLSQLTVEPHSLCYTCWVQVVYSRLPSLLFYSFWDISTASQYQATWRTTSAGLTISRRLSPSRRPCGALFFMYLFYVSVFLELILDSAIIKIFIYNLYAFISRYVLWYLDDFVVYMRDLILAHIWLLDLCSYKSGVTILYMTPVAEPTWIIPAQVRESTPEGSNVLQTV
jgi:hypothetical protein